MSEGLTILYEDKYITITECYILLKKYYMPLMTSKTVLFQDIKTISIQDAQKVNNTWGVCTSFLNNWFQYDPHRKSKNKFISIEIKNSRVRPSFTPEDVNKAFDALRKYFGENDRKSVQFQSNRDKQTQLHQKEAHQMMKQQLEFENEEKKVSQQIIESSEINLKSKKQNYQIKVEEIK